MSEALVSTERPSSLVAAGCYEYYLWLGHCVFNPRDYKRDITGFHQDRKVVNQDYARFKEKRAQGHAAVLLPYLQCVIKNAKHELDLESPMNANRKRQLQVYLVGEVSVRGKEMAEQSGLFEDYPDLADVTSPFVDGRLTDGALRIPRVGNIQESLARYATIEKLLPGYNPVS